ncbi:N-acetyltransferase family protein [Roseibacillus persicicus]|uniref:GNAT family N-acetyltransferase n=1 Tax=Roseibacillus persicicus TaxID=454148 RepID=UPI00398B95CE
MPMIRLFQEGDWQAVWGMLEPVFRAGQTYVYSPEITEQEARGVWVDEPRATYVVVDGGELLGTYYLKANQPGLGAHICNCGYIVSENARARGVASSMCEHSQAEAVSKGFRGMQFNLVVSTNKGAIRLWERLGFKIVGTLPGAFCHPEMGYVDAHIMFKNLKTEQGVAPKA